MQLVVDTSAILSTLDPANKGKFSISLYQALTIGHGVVPCHFWFEVTNTLLKVERFAKMPIAESNSLLLNLRMLNLTSEDVNLEHMMQLAREHHLTSYDAAYLELSLRLHLPLATFDKALIRAALDSGLHLWKPEYESSS